MASKWVPLCKLWAGLATTSSKTTSEPLCRGKGGPPATFRPPLWCAPRLSLFSLRGALGQGRWCTKCTPRTECKRNILRNGKAYIYAPAPPHTASLPSPSEPRPPLPTLAAQVARVNRPPPPGAEAGSRCEDAGPRPHCSGHKRQRPRLGRPRTTPATPLRAARGPRDRSRALRHRRRRGPMLLSPQVPAGSGTSATTPASRPTT